MAKTPPSLAMDAIASEKKQRVAIFFWEGYLGVVPSLINAVKVFSEAGYQVDVVTQLNPGKYVRPPAFHQSVRILEYRDLGSRIRDWFHNSSNPETMSPEITTIAAKLPRGNSKPLTKLFQRVYGVARRLFLGTVIEWFSQTSRRLGFALFGLRHTLARRYVCFIGIDMDGLVIATLIGYLKRVPIVYWSLEIRFLRDFGNSSFGRVLKRAERICNRRSIFTIIQDQQRADALIAENGIESSRVIIVPNGPLGPPYTAESNFFQRKFGLPSSSRIVLHMGRLGPDMLSRELAQSASSWPAEYALVLHEREKRSYDDPYIRGVREVSHDRVLLSLEPVPYDKLDHLVRSAHIGIVVYQKELGPNYALIAGASGKLGHYLRCALPVVCIDVPSLSAVINKYECGLSVSEMSQIPEAIQRICDNYEFYSSNAHVCYKEVYEFSSHFQHVLGKIRQITRHPS